MATASVVTTTLKTVRAILDTNEVTFGELFTAFLREQDMQARNLKQQVGLLTDQLDDLAAAQKASREAGETFNGD